MTKSDSHKPIRLSRAEIETLCLLRAVGEVGCDALAVAPKLGLSPTLAQAVADGLEPLVRIGLLLLHTNGRVTLTPTGSSYLSQRLKDVL